MLFAYREGAMIVIACIFIGFVCLIIGVFIGGIIFESKAKKQLRKRIEGETKPNSNSNNLSDTRDKTRRRVNILEAEVIAPMLDPAGVAFEDEEIKCMVRIVDISKEGVSILSQNFFREGLVLRISCRSKEEKIFFNSKEAEVRNLALLKDGLRIGLQFVVPLEDL
jgi:hypothetical protein